MVLRGHRSQKLVKKLFGLKVVTAVERKLGKLVTQVEKGEVDEGSFKALYMRLVEKCPELGSYTDVALCEVVDQMLWTIHKATRFMEPLTVEERGSFNGDSKGESKNEPLMNSRTGLQRDSMTDSRRDFESDLQTLLQKYSKSDANDGLDELIVVQGPEDL